jgi:large subunit ribosomal protein L10
MQRQVIVEKTKQVNEIKDLIIQYKSLGVASLQKVRAAQLQELKKKLEKSAYLRVTKNTLVRRAIDECKEKPGIERLKEQLEGSNLFMFTNLNPFKLALLLQKSRVRTTAKAGDKAAEDVIAAAGNTGLPPGPIISQLGSVGLPTRIEAGSVWISRDTLLAKKGDVIDARLASVLSKLGLKPVEAGLNLTLMYDNGLVMTGKQLQLDLEATRHDVEQAHASAFNLSLNASYPVSETVSFLVRLAHQNAYNLAISAAIPNHATMADLVRKANMEMISLSSRIPKMSEKTEKTESVQKS